MVDERKRAILTSIGENLRIQRTGSESDREGPGAATMPVSSRDADQEARVQKFAEELTAVGARVFLARTREGAHHYVKEVIDHHRARRVALSAAPILAELEIEALIRAAHGDIIRLPRTPSFDELEEYKRRLMEADLGITGAACGLAESGTLVLLTSETEGRLASLLPPVHLAVLNASHILPGVAEFIAETRSSLRSSDIIFITGPSRTADIELTLTVGVHGPKELHVVVLAMNSE